MQSKCTKAFFYLSKYGSCLSIDWFLRPNLTIIFQKMSISRQAVALLFCIFWFFQWYFSSSSQFFWWDYWLLLTFSRLISSVFETLFWLMLTGVMRRLREGGRWKQDSTVPHWAAAGILSKEGSIEKTRILTIIKHVDDTRVVWTGAQINNQTDINYRVWQKKNEPTFVNC